MNIILIGAPGAGKGTQAHLIQDEYGLVQLSTGDLLRKAIKDGDELGKTAKVYISKGCLVPDVVILGLVKEELKKGNSGNGFILDGFPRNKCQAISLEKLLKEIGMVIDHILVLDVKDEKVIDRLCGRRICKECGESFHITFRPSKKEHLCDQCDGELLQRDDDQEITIKNRLKIYHQQTEEVTEFYSASGKVSKICGEGSIEEIFNRIKKVLN